MAARHAKNDDIGSDPRANAKRIARRRPRRSRWDSQFIGWQTLFAYAEEENAAAQVRARRSQRMIDEMLALQEAFMARGSSEYMNAGAYEASAIVLSRWEQAPLDEEREQDPNRITAADLQPNFTITEFHGAVNRRRSDEHCFRLTADRLAGAFDAVSRHHGTY